MLYDEVEPKRWTIFCIWLKHGLTWSQLDLTELNVTSKDCDCWKTLSHVSAQSAIGGDRKPWWLKHLSTINHCLIYTQHLILRKMQLSYSVYFYSLSLHYYDTSDNALFFLTKQLLEFVCFPVVFPYAVSSFTHSSLLPQTVPGKILT